MPHEVRVMVTWRSRPAELFAAIDRLVRARGGSHGVSPADQQDTGERRRLLDPDARSAAAARLLQLSQLMP
jgi:hypothetical protein